MTQQTLRLPAQGFADNPALIEGEINLQDFQLNNCFCGIIAMDDILVFLGLFFYTGILPEQEDVVVLFGGQFGINLLLAREK